ncbi:MAG: hypothetical protein AB7O73_00630 [Bacteroidia bacterium]
MKQEVKKSEKTEIKTLVSQNFVGAMEEMTEEGIVKNSRQFSNKVKKDQSNFSKIKKGEGRYVTLDVIYEAVNNLGLNANFIFVENGTTKEKLLREGVVTNNNNVSGNNNKISNITPVFQAPVNGHVSVAEKIIQGMPAKDRKEMRKHFDNMASEILDLKKTVDFYKKQLKGKEKELKEKDKKLMDTQEKLIKVIMEQKQK